MDKKSVLSISYWINKYRNIPIQAKLAMWMFVCLVVQRAVSLITVPIFTRLMDATEYGKVSTFFAWENILIIISSFKLNAGVYNKGLSKYKEDRSGYCLAMQYTTSIISVFLLGLYLIFHNYVNSFTGLSTPLTILMFVEVLFHNAMGFWSVKVRYDFKYKSVATATLTLAFLNPVLGIIFVLNTPDHMRGTARIISVVLAQIMVGVFFYLLNIIRGKFRFQWKYAKFALIFNLPLIPHYLSEYILNQSDRIMIQKMCSYTEVAFYSVAYNAGMILTILNTSLNQAVTPWLYQSLDAKNYKKINNVIMSLAVIVMIPVMLFIILAPEAIYILAGSKYASAIYVIPPVAGSLVFLFLYVNFATVEFYYDYNKFTMYISVVGAVANIILNYIFIPIFGYVAAGYTTFVCYFVYCAGHYLFMEKIMKRETGQRLMDGKILFGLFAILCTMMILMSVIYRFVIIRYIFIVVLLVICLIFRKKIIEMINIVRKRN